MGTPARLSAGRQQTSIPRLGACRCGGHNLDPGPNTCSMDPQGKETTANRCSMNGTVVGARSPSPGRGRELLPRATDFKLQRHVTSRFPPPRRGSKRRPRSSRRHGGSDRARARSTLSKSGAWRRGRCNSGRRGPSSGGRRTPWASVQRTTTEGRWRVRSTPGRALRGGAAGQIARGEVAARCPQDLEDGLTEPLRVRAVRREGRRSSRSGRWPQGRWEGGQFRARNDGPSATGGRTLWAGEVERGEASRASPGRAPPPRRAGGLGSAGAPARGAPSRHR